MRVVVSSTSDAVVNAAMEETLFRRQPEEPALFLYVNGSAVIIGRNQNPWMECDVAYCRENSIPLLRRISGGGTVYHDGGNLNYSFILPKESYNPDELVTMVAETLEKLTGVELAMNSHYSLFAGERKVSGTAFALTSQAALLHGCILVSTDISALERVLESPAGIHVEGANVASNRAIVTTLNQLCPNLSVSFIRDGIIATVKRNFDLSSSGIEELDSTSFSGDEQFEKSRRQFSDDVWTYGHSSDFIFRVTLPGGVLSLSVSTGIVRSGYFLTNRGERLLQNHYNGNKLSDLTAFHAVY